MKTILYILVFSLILHLPCMAEKNKKIPKNVNTILIYTNYKDKDEAFQKLGILLLDKNIGLKKTNKDFYYIASEPELLKRSTSARLKFNIIYIDFKTVIKITGEYCFHIDIDLGQVTEKQSWDKIINKGMKGSPAKIAFEYLQKISKLIPHKNLEYLIKN